MVLESPVGPNPPTSYHAFIPTLITPLPSLQQPLGTSPHHTPSIAMPHQRLVANTTYTYSMPIILPPGPSLRFFLTLWLLGNEGCMYPPPTVYIPYFYALTYFI